MRVRQCSCRTPPSPPTSFSWRAFGLGLSASGCEQMKDESSPVLLSYSSITSHSFLLVPLECLSLMSAGVFLLVVSGRRDRMLLSHNTSLSLIASRSMFWLVCLTTPTHPFALWFSVCFRVSAILSHVRILLLCGFLVVSECLLSCHTYHLDCTYLWMDIGSMT